jgi:hypothetical protein
MVRQIVLSVISVGSNTKFILSASLIVGLLCELKFLPFEAWAWRANINGAANSSDAANAVGMISRIFRILEIRSQLSGMRANRTLRFRISSRNLPREEASAGDKSWISI